jgi:hypothetical protein
MAELLLGRPGIDEKKHFQKIAADKASFEDMIGFPNVKMLADEGRITYTPTPVSIMDKEFILIDEISRCNPSLQNKFLELVLDRQVMGIPTDIRWVWATMNPLEYAGSQPLDEALAGRMGYILAVEETIKMNDSNIKKVISTQNVGQSPALGFWLGETTVESAEFPQALSDELHEVLGRAARLSQELIVGWQPIISDYVLMFAKTLKTNAGLDIDGRRMTMIGKNLISNIAVQTAWSGHSLDTPEIKELCKETLLISLPWLATGTKTGFDKTKVLHAHEMASGVLANGDTLLYKIITEQDPLRKTELYLRNRDQVDPSTATNLVASLYDPVQPLEFLEDTWKAQAERFMIKLALTQIVLNLPKVPPDVLALVAKNYPVQLKYGYARDRKDIKVVFTSAIDMDRLTSLYNRATSSASAALTSQMYFALESDAGTYTYEQIVKRLEIAQAAYTTVTSALRPYFVKGLPVSVNVTSSSNQTQGNAQAGTDALTANGRVGDPQGTLDRVTSIV